MLKMNYFSELGNFIYFKCTPEQFLYNLTNSLLRVFFASVPVCPNRKIYHHNIHHNRNIVASFKVKCFVYFEHRNEATRDTE